ncbi:MAG: exodeoxyribonuclease VII small subunit [Pseudomonadota bacterium]
MTSEESPKFADLLRDLDEICERLQSTEQPLETSIEDFEHGMSLLKQAKSALAEAEQKVQFITAQTASENESGE